MVLTAYFIWKNFISIHIIQKTGQYTDITYIFQNKLKYHFIPKDKVLKYDYKAMITNNKWGN